MLSSLPACITPDTLARFIALHRKAKNLLSEGKKRLEELPDENRKASGSLNDYLGYPANLSGMDLRDFPLADVDLSGANLTGTNLSGMVLWNTRFEGAILEHARLEGAELAWANLCGAQMKD